MTRSYCHRQKTSECQRDGRLQAEEQKGLRWFDSGFCVDSRCRGHEICMNGAWTAIGCSFKECSFTMTFCSWRPKNFNVN